MGKDGYTTVRLPKELIDEIDAIVKEGKWGYRTRAEFVKEAIRQQLIKLKYEQN